MKDKILLIDIDGTICCDIRNEDSHLFPEAKPYDGAVEHINRWFENGNTIIFFTAREEKDRTATTQWLNDHNFKFHNLIMDKPRCKDGQEYVWIDNRPVRAVTYKGMWGEFVPQTHMIMTFGNISSN